MEPNYERNNKPKRLSELEKMLEKSRYIFSASVLTTIVCSLSLVHPTSESSSVIPFLSCVPITYIAWLNSMSYKTEEYCQLAREFYSTNK